MLEHASRGHVANQGAGVLKLAKNGNVDHVVLDYQMLRMTTGKSLNALGHAAKVTRIMVSSTELPEESARVPDYIVPTTQIVTTPA